MAFVYFCVLVSILSLVSAFPSRLASRDDSFPAPIICTGPAVRNTAGLHYQDFSVIQRVSDGKYFRFSKANDTGLGLSVATAPSLQGDWTYSYAALSGALKSPLVTPNNRANTHLWAPEVHYRNGLYYLFYNINVDGQFDISVATGTDLVHWDDQGSLGVPKSPTGDYVRLGSNLLTNGSDPSGVGVWRHLAFGSWNAGLYGITLSEDLKSIAPGAQPHELIADQHNTGSAAGNKTEGPYQFHFRDYIYLFYSVGSCCPGGPGDPSTVYRIEVCRAKYSDGPAGPYFDRDGNNCISGPLDRPGTIVQKSSDDFSVYAPGSPGILHDPKEGLVMYYQYYNYSSGAEQGLRFGYNYLDFDAADWPVLKVSRANTSPDTY